MANLLDLATQMRQLAASLPRVGNEARKRAAHAFLDSVTEDSPVDTGRFVSNWQIGHGVGAEIEPYAEGLAGSTRQANVEAARAVGHDAINAIEPGQPLVIFNPTDYGEYLNSGSSSRPPLLFVEKATLVASLAIRAAKGLFNG